MIDKSSSRKNIRRRVKSEIIDSPRGSGVFFLQRYEIIIMLLGAGIISLLIFFVFLKPSGDNKIFKTDKSNEPVTIEDFQNQIDRLSAMVEKAALKENQVSGKKDKPDQRAENTKSAWADHEKRLERIEASLSIKYETLANRINRLERSIDKLNTRLDSIRKKTKVAKKQASIRIVTKSSKKKETRKRAAKKKEPVFHTVEKGDTLYSLSKKYGTSVRELEKINHLPKNANIYPGDNLLIK